MPTRSARPASRLHADARRRARRVPRVVERAGFDATVRRRGSRPKPDPDFPTAPFPNPEEPGVLDLALDLARRHRADLVLANDPDADRLAVAIPEAGRLAGPHRRRDRRAARRAHARVERRATTASSPVPSCRRDCSTGSQPRPACRARATLTGFKWISRAGDTDGRRLVFGYEEALGYAVTPRCATRTGSRPALAIADLAARGSLTDALDALAAAHGLHATAQWSMRFADNAAASAFIAGVRARLRRLHSAASR